MIAISYHKDYIQYDLGLTHPLVGDKPKKTMEFYEKKSILRDAQVFEPKPAREEDLMRVHSPSFVRRIKEISDRGGMLTVDTPVPRGIYDAARLATGGSMLCGEKLISDFKISLNPLGGFHHASKDTSSGFCFFNDVAVAIEYLREEYEIDRFLIVDLDVHHANGTQDLYYGDSSVLNISFHQDGRTLYPGKGFVEEIGSGKGEGYTVNLPFLPGASNKSYLYAFDTLIPPLIKDFEPEVIVYQSGVDTHHSDPLADIRLTLLVFHLFARKIKQLAMDSCRRLLVLLGGGYNSQSSVYAYYNIAAGLLGRDDFVDEEDIQDRRIRETKQNVDKLVNLLSPYFSSLR